MPTPLLSGRSPYEYLHGQVPNYSLLRVFGSSCFVLLPKKDRTKLSAWCVLCVFLGYGIYQEGYRCYDPITKKLYVSRHVTFFECFPYFTLPSKAAPVAKEDLIYLDPFPFDVPTEEYSSTLDIADIPLPVTTPEVSDCPPPSVTSSLPSLISPALLVYSCRHAASPIPPSNSMALSSDFRKPDLPASRYPTRSCHPPVYMRPPLGLSPPPRLVCRFRRALYGLKQSPRAWYARFQAIVLQIGFQPSVHDSTLFVRHTSHAISDVKDHIFREFKMKDLGPLRYFLGIEVASSPKCYLLSQTKYITDILHRAHLTDDKTVDIPLELHAKLSATDGVLLEDPTLYLSMSLLLALHIGLHCCEFCDMPGPLLAFVFFWVILLSPGKAKSNRLLLAPLLRLEYRAMAHATSEIVWLRWLLSDIGVNYSSPTPLYCDNKSAIQIAHNSVFHERMKHIEIDCHFVHQHLQSGTITLPFVSTTLQLADFFTKTHTTARFHFLLDKLSMLSALAS
ncbi:hypothetical protein Acr_14g0005450 [Actinidia rufa]|uniref:Reverse transcriptase Ty1/copia-type domain-containing protein n=1 Tax=Actinidia rufa TaxID=165716 RepID=A0A7J0FRV6_9ERIC|nr:hypothetical protein Acr_14g0005450 [Actinidia rufa]